MCRVYNFKTSFCDVSFYFLFFIFLIFSLDIFVFLFMYAYLSSQLNSINLSIFILWSLISCFSQEFKNVHLYLAPLGVAILSWFVALVIGTSCGSKACVKTTTALRKVYLFLAFALAVLVYKCVHAAMLWFMIHSITVDAIYIISMYMICVLHSINVSVLKLIILSYENQL